VVSFLPWRINGPGDGTPQSPFRERMALASETGLWCGLSCLFSMARIH
jgi:hypothetical protein